MWRWLSDLAMFKTFHSHTSLENIPSDSSFVILLYLLWNLCYKFRLFNSLQFWVEKLSFKENPFISQDPLLYTGHLYHSLPPGLWFGITLLSVCLTVLVFHLLAQPAFPSSGQHRQPTWVWRWCCSMAGSNLLIAPILLQVVGGSELGLGP